MKRKRQSTSSSGTKRRVAGEPLPAPMVLHVNSGRADGPTILMPRMLTLVMALVAIGFLCFAGYQACAAVGRVLYSENDRFTLSVEDIRVTSNRQHKPLGKLVVLDLAGIDPSTNLFSLSLRELRNSLLDQPFIQAVEIERELPNSLTINVKERIEVARIPIDKYGNNNIDLLVDIEGNVIRKAPRSRVVHLPAIERLHDSPNKKVGYNVARSKARHALQLLTIFEQKHYLKKFLPIESIRVDDPERLVIKLTNGKYIIPMRDGLPYSLPRFAQALDQLPEVLGRDVNILTHNAMDHYFATVEDPRW